MKKREKKFYKNWLYYFIFTQTEILMLKIEGQELFCSLTFECVRFRFVGVTQYFIKIMSNQHETE